MLTNLLLERYLRELGLPTFVQNYATVAQEAALTERSCEDYLLALCEAELSRRTARRIERAIAAARLPVHKELSQFDWSRVPTNLKARVLELAQGRYIAQARPVLLLGNPGVGKTHLATGLALAACRQGYRVRFSNVAVLVQELLAAQHQRTLARLLATLGKHDLLILDEFGFVPFSPQEAQLFFHLCSALSERVALILTSHLRLTEWTRVLGGEELVAAALLERLTHRAHLLEVRGASFRSPEQQQQDEPPGAAGEKPGQSACPHTVPPLRTGKPMGGRPAPGPLTAREMEVLRLVAEGLTDPQIATRLVISPRTVHGHMGSIFNKLHMNSRSAATRYAVEHQLV